MTAEHLGIQALPCSTEELIEHVLPTLGPRACQFLLDEVTKAPHEMMTLCFVAKAGFGVGAKGVGRSVEWEFKSVLSMSEAELELVASRLPTIKRLYASRKAWQVAIHTSTAPAH